MASAVSDLYRSLDPIEKESLDKVLLEEFQNLNDLSQTLIRVKAAFTRLKQLNPSALNAGIPKIEAWHQKMLELARTQRKNYDR